jgi:Flp pilus assembly protein TadD
MGDTADPRTGRIQALFASALSLDPAARHAVLDRACTGDAELRKAVDDLLRDYDSAQQFFGQFPEGFARDLLGLAAAPAAFQDGELVAGRFRIVGFIGAGGMGEVYEAEDLLLERERVALKTLPADIAGDERAIARLKREMALARRVTHPNVCRVFDVDQHTSSSGTITAFFTMELLHGETLAARLRRSGALSTEDARPLVGQMAAALDAAHLAGVVHGDFKPGNVVLVGSLGGGERLVITDFGLARRASTDTARESSNSSRVGWGTPGYMAPEQFAGRPATRATDVYALGAVVSEMVTGKPQLETDAAGSTDLDAAWRSAIARCLAYDPDARFETVDEFVRALSSRGSRMRWRLAIGLGALGVALVLLISPVLSRMRATGASGPAAPSPAETQHSVAMLAFASADSTPDAGALARGLSATIADQLDTATQQNLRLSFVPPAALLATGVNNPASAHRTLGADLIVMGRVDGGTEQRHVTLQLYHASTPNVTAGESRRVEVRNHDRILPLVRSEVARILDVPLTPAAVLALDTNGTKAAAAEDGYLRGRGYLEQGRAPHLDVAQLDQAIAAFEQTIQLDARFAQAHAGLSEALVSRYEATKATHKDTQLLDRAERSAAEACRLQPTVAHFQVVQALTYLATGRHSLAIPSLEQALGLDPDAVGARKALAASYLATGQLPKAEQTLEDGIRLHPRDWSAQEDLGVFRLNQGQYKKAETHFVAGREYAPDNPRVISNLAVLYTMTELFDAAEQELKRGLELAPDPLLYNNLGWAYFYQGDFPKGVQSLKKAAVLAKDDSVVLAGLARGYRWVGSHAEARAAYAVAMAAARREASADPTNAEVRANLAYLCAETGNHGEARRLIDLALEQAPGNVRVRFTSALVFEITGNRQAALNALQSAISGGHPKYQIAHHPDLRALRTDPRYVQLIGRVAWKR